MFYQVLKTKGVFAANCKVSGKQLEIGLLILVEPMGKISLVTPEGDRLNCDLSGVSAGTSYKVNLPNGIYET